MIKLTARTSLGPRPFSNFFHTHAQQRGRGERKGSGDTAYPSADPGMSTILICGYYSSVRARARAAITIIMNNEKH